MKMRRIIKEGPIVLATSEDGSIDAGAASTLGLFLADTRFLSRFQIYLNDCEPLLLGSTEEMLFELAYLFTNPAMENIPERAIGLLQKNSLAERSSGLADVHMDISLINWSLKEIEVDLAIEIGADFFDSFEARGVKRLKRGQIMEPQASAKQVELSYLGLDNVRDVTCIKTSQPMSAFTDSRMHFAVRLAPGDRAPLELELTLSTEAKGVHLLAQPEITGKQKPDWFDDHTKIGISDSVIRSILDRGTDDLEALLTEFPEAWVPVAGLPRFAVPFGRDSIMTGLQTLSWNPALSRDVLRFLASRQGKEVNEWNYEQPGKIMHEMHTGELARLREVPFGLFYGSVDSTPLFLVLAAEYVRWTQDLEFFKEIKPHLDAAWTWIDTYGDIDGSGYIQYAAHTPPVASSGALTVGLFNQGWKDSSIAVVYSNGEIVRDHPITLAEVQGYLYRALHLWGRLYQTMPDVPEALRDEGERMLHRAAALKRRFNREFWMENRHFYAMALDGHHNQVDVVTSNPGHCLWARMIDDEHAADLAAGLVHPEVFSSWGIRTMSTAEKAFNAFSYHDGSIWPFENALILAGLKKYGYVQGAQQVHQALIDATSYFEYRRWPEVYCGVTRETAGVLARQPDACSPQAWSAGAIFLMLQTWIGVAPRPFSRHVDITPVLPAGITELEIREMSVCGSRLSLRLLRENGSLLIEIKDNPGNLDIMIHPASSHERHLAGSDNPAQVR